jgi:tetratricopeptide (TPR) repeat protein
MSFWQRLFGNRAHTDLRPQRLDYLNEGLALERQGDFDAALTSYRLALRDHPTDLRVLQNIAIAYSKTRQHDEAIRYYRKALEIDNGLGGAHYGLAFLLLKRGEVEAAVAHLNEFLARPPRGPDGQKWVEHAQKTLEELQASEEV